MCIRDSHDTVVAVWTGSWGFLASQGCDDDAGGNLTSSLNVTLYGGTTYYICLLYTSDAADERSSVDLGGRRIIKKKNKRKQIKKKTKKKKKKTKKQKLSAKTHNTRLIR